MSKSLSITPWLSLIATGILTAIGSASHSIVPVHYEYVIDDHEIVRNDDWPEDGRLHLSELVEVDGWGTGPHKITYTVFMSDGSVTPPATINVFIEPGARIEQLSNLAITSTSEGFSEVTAPWPAPGNESILFHVPLENVATGPHTLNFNIGIDNPLSPLLTGSLKLFVERNRHSHLSVNATPSDFQLLDDGGNSVLSADELILESIESNVWKAWLTQEQINQLPNDATYYPVITMSDGAKSIDSDTNLKNPLYHQESFNEWMQRMAPEHAVNPYSDLDGDGLMNGTEWYLRLNPTSPDRGVTPHISIVKNKIYLTWLARGGFTTTEFAQFEAYDFGVIAKLQQSYNLGSSTVPANWEHSDWNLETAKLNRSAEPDGLEKVEIILQPDVSLLPSQFFRWAPATAF